MIQFLTISTNFKVSLLHEGTSEIGKEYFIGCYTPELKDGERAFFLEGIQKSSLILKKPKQTKQHRYFI